MEVEEESNQQIAKRQAIQEIMRDTSLSPQEKQRKIQQFMATGGRAAPSSSPSPAPAPPPVPAPAPAPTPVPPQPTTPTSSRSVPNNVVPASSKQALMQAVMRDTSLTPQEKQKRIQEIMSNGGSPAPPVARNDGSVGPSASETSAAPSPGPSPVTPTSSGGGGGGGGNREAIQAVMRDTSLTPQERQKKIQEIMANGGSRPSGGATPRQEASPAQAPAPAPPPPTPTSARSPSNAAPASSKQMLMQAVMRDTSLNPQEKQKKIQEIMSNGGSPAAPTPSSSTAAASSPSVSSASSLQPQQSASSTSTTQSATRKAMQEIMQDSSLTPQEKQKRIQAIMSNSSPASPPPPSAASASSSAAVQPGASSMGTAADPAARKAGRSSRILDSQSTGNAAPSQAMRASTSGRGDDPAARKVARESTRNVSGVNMAASRCDDPAARKMARESTRSVSSSTPGGSSNIGTSAAAPTASLAPASSSNTSRNDDPAARKLAGESARMGRRGNRASTASLGRASDRQDPLTPSIPEHSHGGTEGSNQPPQSSMPSYNAADSSQSRPSYNEADSRAKTESEPSSDFASPPLPPPVVNEPEPQPDYGIENSNAQPPRSIPSIQQPTDDPINELQPARENNVAHAGSERPPSSPLSQDIAGADTGGIEAYVPGQQQADDDAVLATQVVTEEEIANEDRRKQIQYLWRGACCFCCAVIIIIILVIVLREDEEPPAPAANVTEAPSEQPSMAPTSGNYADLLSILRIRYSNDTAFDQVFGDGTTAQSMAASWAADIAPEGLAGTDPRMLSRYALAAFYYSVGGDDWTRCGQGSTNCVSGSEWLTANSECDWAFIECVENDFTVKEIYFPPITADGNNIVGTLPLDLSFLSGLQRLVVAGETLKGTVPSEFGDLTQLTSVILSANELTGVFPDFMITENPLLTTIYFSSNRLTGVLPSLQNSPALEDLRVHNNLLTGPIPSLSGATSLKFLILENNDFSGIVPDELYDLTSLNRLRLSDNLALGGTLSEDISQLTELIELNFTNTGVGGALPEGLFDLAKLENLELGRASFSGTLSESFGRLSNLSFIRLNNNTFTSTVPSAFAQLPFLQELELHYNDLTGSISAELCNRTGDSFSDIKEITADCAGNQPQLNCSCCTCF